MSEVISYELEAARPTHESCQLDPGGEGGMNVLCSTAAINGSETTARRSHIIRHSGPSENLLAK
jgi:hypothetical protein